MKNEIIDFEVINAYLGPEDDVTLISDLIEYFKKNAPMRLESARTNFCSGNEKQFKYYLHALKNSFLNIGALIAAEDCQDLENQANNLPTDEVNRRLDAFANYIHNAKTEVSRFILERADAR